MMKAPPHTKIPHAAEQQARLIASQWQEQLLTWYANNGRFSLPWRNLQGENAPYGVYVSEIMLQQTQVKRVEESYYTPFLKAFPTLTALAFAPLDSILKLWEGLGYYTRARNMQKAALLCYERHNKGHNATLPQTYEELLALPGIGAYSAGAILCFGFRQSVSFVDGNIRRVLCRIFALSKPSPTLLNELASILLDTKHSFDYNQALLDLGAMICTPKSPSCLICPVRNLCHGYVNPTLYPTPKASRLQPLTLHLALCISADNTIAFIQEQDSLYQGLYNLPRLKPKHIARYKPCGSFKHHYTKYAITAHVYMLSPSALKRCMPLTEVHYLSLEELDSKPLSSLCKKALRFV